MAVASARKRLRAPLRSAAAPSSGEINAVSNALIATPRDHHAVPVTSSGAIALVKYVA